MQKSAMRSAVIWKGCWKDMFRHYPGNESIIRRLKRQAQSGNLSHAYIFECFDTEMAGSIAEDFIKAFLCREMPGEGCDACPVCRKIDHGNYVDLHYVRSTAATGNLLVADVEALIGKLMSKPMDGDLKIAVIENAHKMNVQAQNKLLKTLEEPPGDTVMILLCSNTEALLPTILSRCVTYRFRHSGDIDDALMVRAGEIAEAIKNSSSFFMQTRWVKDAASDERLPELLDALELYYSNILTGRGNISGSGLHNTGRGNVSGSGVHNSGRGNDRSVNNISSGISSGNDREVRNGRSRTGSGYTIEQLDRAIHSIEEAKRQLAGNVYKEHVLKALTIKIGG